MSKAFSKFFLKAMGWTPVGGPIPDKKSVALGVPHTCLADFLIAYHYYRSVGGRINIMVKKEFFFWPAGPILRWLGAIPVDRSHPSHTYRDILEEFKKRDVICLGLSPEGTRKPVKQWKMGFHHIARAAGVPVYLSFMDWKTRRVGIGERFECTEDAHADLLTIQRYYKKMGVEGRHPNQFVFLDEVANGDE